MRHFVFFLFVFAASYSQERPPFERFNPKDKAIYLRALNELEKTTTNALEKNQKHIKLASQFNNQDDLITALENKLALQGETAHLRYLLGGANGIKATQISKFLSFPYVKAMLRNFERSVAIDSTYTPALEAYIESLCMVPDLLGGDLDKAVFLADHLERLSPVEGLFSKGFIAQHQGKVGSVFYAEAFALLSTVGFCHSDLSSYFADKSMNFAYKVAEVSAHFKLSPALGLCAINHFLKHRTPYDNIPIEWIYFRKGQLHLLLEENELADKNFKKALKINPKLDSVINSTLSTL